VDKPEPHFGWEDTGISWSDKWTGSTINKLNVTSLQWLNSTVYDIPVENFTGDPSIWKHEVFVIEPPQVVHRNIIMVWATDGCNTYAPTTSSDDEMNAVTAAAYEGQFVTVVIK
jgi:hypothetical protein